VEAYPPQANTQEAWLATIDDSGSTAWYEDEERNGGLLNLAIEVFDWQSMWPESTVADEVAAIWFESDLVASPIEISSLSIPEPAGPASSVWNVELDDLSLTSAGAFECWVGIEASYPENYAPQIEADPYVFDWPDTPLTAYMRGTVHVLDSNPSLPPEITLVEPSEGIVSVAISDVQIIGNRFEDGATVSFENDIGDSLGVTNILRVDPTLITCDLDCIGPPGFYNVTITNPDMQFDMLEDGFELTEPFECEGSAHDWAGLEHEILGLPIDPNVYRFEMAILHQGSHAGMALFQIDEYNWGLIDPAGGGGQTIQPFLTTDNKCYCMDIETCETTGRIGILSYFNPDAVWLYDAEGNPLGDFVDWTVCGGLTAFDFDRNGDMWAVARMGAVNEPENWDFELRHYALLEDHPWYELVPEDTVLLNDVAMTGPIGTQGIGDLGISFFLHRLFILSANHGDGGSNRLTAWDLNQSPPVLAADRQNPFPPLCRKHIFNNGAYTRLNVDVDHRFPEDPYEQCRVYAYASIWTYGPPGQGLDMSVIRLDADLNLLDEGEVWHPPFPACMDYLPQCVILNDAPGGNGNLVGCGWHNHSFYEWPVPSDW